MHIDKKMSENKEKIRDFSLSQATRDVSTAGNEIQLLADAQNCRSGSPNGVLYFKLLLELEVPTQLEALS